MNRDEFAAAALTGLIAHGPGKDLPVEMRSTEYLVRFSYEIADEMVRQQKPCADNIEIFELACAVSDAWVAIMADNHDACELGDLNDEPGLCAVLDKLEEATRPRAMRKVRGSSRKRMRRSTW